MATPGFGHLVRRFVTSLVPFGPRSGEDGWARALLLDEEQRLWRRMSRIDRRHAVAVARRVERALGDEATRPVLAAALLHDVGKIDAHLGTYGRVVATVSAAVAGRHLAEAWSEQRGFTRRVGLYLRHPELGAVHLALAGSDPLTVAWAREHHLAPEEWTVPTRIGHALRAADND